MYKGSRCLFGNTASTTNTRRPMTNEASNDFLNASTSSFNAPSFRRTNAGMANIRTMEADRPKAAPITPKGMINSTDITKLIAVAIMFVYKTSFVLPVDKRREPTMTPVEVSAIITDNKARTGTEAV